MKTPIRTVWTLLVSAALTAALMAGCGTTVQQARVVDQAPAAAPAPLAPTPATPPPAAPAPAPSKPPAPAPAPPAKPQAPAPPPAPQPPPQPAATPVPAAPAPAAPAVPQYTIEQFLGTVNFNGASFSPDATKILVGSNQTGIFNAYAVPVTGGAPVALTHSTTDNVRPLSFFPHDERFLYISDKGGNELDHVYVQGTDGKAQDLTPGDKLKASFLDWAQDDRSFFVSTNERDPRYFDVYEIEADGYARKLLYKNDSGLDFAAISPDRKTLAFIKSGGSTADTLATAGDGVWAMMTASCGGASSSAAAVCAGSADGTGAAASAAA